MQPVLSKFATRLSRASGDENGASAVEWSVLAACIAAVVTFSIGDVGQRLAALYSGAASIIGIFL